MIFLQSTDFERRHLAVVSSNKIYQFSVKGVSQGEVVQLFDINVMVKNSKFYVTDELFQSIQLDTLSSREIALNF